MIGGAIPDNDHGTALEPPPQPPQKAHRFLPIRRRRRKRDGSTGQHIQCPIIRLPFGLVDDRDLNPVSPGPPRISQCIPPPEMTLIDKEPDDPFGDQADAEMRRFFWISSRFASTCPGSAEGFRFCVFFQDIFARFKSA
jgi:hypothetical protein